MGVGVGGGAEEIKTTGSCCHGHPSQSDNSPPHPKPFSDHTGESTQKRTPPWVFIISRRHTVSADVRGGAPWCVLCCTAVGLKYADETVVCNSRKIAALCSPAFISLVK